LANRPSKAGGAETAFAELNRQQKTDMLEMLFGEWKQRTAVSASFINDYNKPLSMQGCLIAKALVKPSDSLAAPLLQPCAR
jgi:hypothetical protein